MEINKIKTYLNFAKKSGKLLLGVDDIIKSKTVHVILISNDLAESSKNKITLHSKKFNIKLFEISKENFFELTLLQSVKALAVADKNLAEAIKLNLTNNC